MIFDGERRNQVALRPFSGTDNASNQAGHRRKVNTSISNDGVCVGVHSRASQDGSPVKEDQLEKGRASGGLRIELCP